MIQRIEYFDIENRSKKLYPNYEENIMNIDKYVMLKATLNQQDYLTPSIIKNSFNVDGVEAEEMLSNLIQEGLVEPYPIDGTHYKVKK